MGYHAVYIKNIQQIVSACIIDARESLGLKGKNSVQIKQVIDQYLSQLNDQSLVYKIESDSGNLAGYFVFQVKTSNRTAQVLQTVLRSNYQSKSIEVSVFINQFLQSDDWKMDYLF